MSTFYNFLGGILPALGNAMFPRATFRVVSRMFRALSYHTLIPFVALLLMSVGFAKAQCSITLTPTVSGCYSVSGVSKATVSVEVAWANAPDNDYIVVTTGVQSRTIIPGVSVITYPQPTTVVITGSQNIVTPQVVAFELTLSGGASTGTVTAKFASNTSCQASQTYAIPAACPPTSCTGTQLGGTVFRDFSADGIKQATETQGVASVTVTAFDCDGVKYGPVVTDQFGKYVFTSTAIKYPVRIEFRTAAGNDMGTIYGSSSHSNVQFVEQATCSVDLGIANPYLYCQPDPQIFIPCYTYGDPLTLNPTPPVATSALSAGAAAVVSFPYDESTTGATGVSHWSDAGQVGTVWGLGYNRLTKDVFMAATLHRHSGLGPLGLGGIYVTHTKSSTITEGFIDVTTLGVDVGAASVPENGSAGRGLSADLTKPSHDPDVFPLIGKVGIGGLEVAENGQKLWFVNLNDKKLYSIDISAYNASGTLPTKSDVKSYPIPDPGCVGGESRPWALHIYNSKLYVGTVCDAFDSKSKSKLRAYVYAFDPGTAVFTPVFDFPLTYPKGYGISPLNSAGQAGADSTGWYPWTDTFNDLVIATSTAVYKSLVHPQPILADIDFDVDGSMVLGFADRTGFQGGYNNYSPNPSETQLYTVNPAAGDILRAYYSNGSYILENNGKVGPYTGVGVNNNQGPGFGEFYDDNYISGTRYVHTELVLGGLALRLGSGHVVGATIDPVTNIANSGGVKYWNNETGKAEAAAIVYTTSTAPGTFAKASGLGEPELNCDLLEVIEIGNRVWVDTNKDGVQDPCEKSMSGVQVDLYKGTTKIASTTTNANGEYYFSSKSALTSGTWLGTSADTTLLPNTAYALVFGAGQFNNSVLTVKGSKLELTVANSTTTNASDLNDSDALIATVAGVTAPVISLTTGNAGYINHNLDAGFSCLPTTVASVSVTAATCTGGTANSNARITVSGIQNADKVFLVAANSVLPSYTATGSQPVSASAASFTGLSNPASTSGQSYSVVVYNGPCCYTVLTTTLPFTNCCSLSATATPTACNSVTNKYTLDGTISLVGNTSGGVATITNGVASTTVSIAPNATTASYSLIGLISDGASRIVTVSLSSCGSATAAYAAPASCTVAAVCSISATAQVTCHNNGTLNVDTDDYITFLLTPYSAGQGSRFTVTATQNGTPISLSLSDGTSLTALSYAYPTPLRSPLGTAGKGNILVTLTDVNNATCTTQITIVDPGTCGAATCVGSTTQTVTYTYRTPFQTTELENVALLLPQFNDGSKTLTKVDLSYGIAEGTNFLLENTAATAVTYRANFTSDVTINLGATSLLSPTLSYTTGTISLPAGVTVAAQDTYGGDLVYSGTHLSTLEGMKSWLSTYMLDIFVDPRTDARWVTNATGSTGTDADIYVVAPQTLTATGATSYTSTTDLSQFIGSGNVPLTVTTLSGIASSGGGGNVIMQQNTKAYGYATVTYTYTCNVSCALAATATPGTCNSATNQYSVSGIINLTGTSGGVATIADGTHSTTISIGASATSVAYSLTGLASGTGSHTVTVSLPDCGTTTATYTAPASCTVAPCGLAMILTPGLCQSATNGYVLSGTLTATNVPTSGTLTISSGAFSPRSLTLPVGNASGTFSYSGLVSDGQVYTVTASYSDGACSPVSQTYTAPASCSVAPVCSLSATATAGLCATATNTYSASVVVSLANAPAGTLTVNIPGSSPISQTIVANTSSFTAVFQGLTSDGASHTATISLPGCGTTTATFTAPASCSVAPVCSISAVATAGVCQTATNTYSSTVVVTVKNPVSGTLSIIDGAQTLTFSTTANAQNTFTATFNGLTSDGTTHTVTASLPDCSTATATYTAPASCSIAPVCSISAVATAGVCATATNTYSASVVVSLANAPAGTLTISIPGSSPISQTIVANTSSFTAVFQGLTSDGASHTATISLPGCGTTTATFTAPASCSVAPVCNLSLTASGANCNPATNLYVLSGAITLTNSPASQTLTLTDGSYVRSLTASAGTTTINYSYTTLQSDGAVHTVTVTSSATACGTASATYTAPASCTVAPVCSVSALATPGICASATNTYSSTVAVTMTNPTAGTLTVTDGVNSVTFAVAASTGTTTANAIFNGLVSNGAVHTVTATLSGCSSTTTTYTAPVACTVCSTSITTASLPNGQVGTVYSQTLTTSGSTGALSFTNVGSLPAGLTLNGSTGVISGTPTASGTVTFTIAVTDAKSCSDSQPLTIIISDAPVCSLTATATPGQCNTATNQYTLTGTVAATNATGTQSLTISVGSVKTVVSLSGNGPVSYTLGGLNSDGAVHTVSILSSATACGSASVTYAAPASCTVALASLGDFVWIDLNKDGIQDGIEPGIEGVKVTLFINGGASTTTTTDASGLYSFTGLTPGNSFSYAVGFTVPTGYTTTIPLSGTDKAKDSDADLITGKSASVTLAPGEFNQTLDAGYIAPELPAAIASLGDFVWLDSDKNGIQDFGEPGIQGVTAILYINGASSATTVTNASGFYSFTGLTPGSSNSYVVGFTAPAGYTATTPYSGTDRTKDSNANLITGKTEAVTLTAGEFNRTLDAGYYLLPPALTLDKVVDKSKAKQGDILTYTLVLTNIGSTTATNVTVRDSTTIGLSYVANSASAPVGTTFTQGNPISLWTVSSLTPGQSLSLTFQAKADSSGILYNVATIPGDTAKVCTSVPVRVCQGSGYLFELTVAAGRSSYKWYRDGIEIVGATTNVLSVTAAGTYSLLADGGTGQCADFSCCPFIVEEDTLPTFKAVAIPVTCVGNVAQTNGQIVLSEFKAGYTYQYSLGSTFNASATLSGAAKAIPVGGVIVSNLVNPVTTQNYTIRVYNSNGCYTDVTVLLTPTVCGCPASVCVPLVIRQTKGPKRAGH
ncbi:MAG: DUF11 domain-containing protein [Spirosoma sp.]|uniref:SdrD B-like domain-containing protein n=2 Tax=unclassified Spirosoma TaxID=2621999 RepID=UPI000B0C6AC4|nr:SdrD B-like domain-containing protein [Spirosoma sp.]MBN8820600.1 DUF11 domain-containing protein [Spirosoma sp.]